MVDHKPSLGQRLDFEQNGATVSLGDRNYKWRYGGTQVAHLVEPVLHVPDKLRARQTAQVTLHLSTFWKLKNVQYSFETIAYKIYTTEMIEMRLSLFLSYKNTKYLLVQTRQMDDI